MLKKLTKYIFIFLIMVMTIPVFAKELVSLEKIVGKTDDKEVVLNATDAIDLNFNDLGQKATYKVKLKNNTDDVLYINDLVSEGLSEEFIDFSLGEKSVNAKIEAGKTKEVEVNVKTLDITHAGRNVNDEVTLKFLLGDKIKNPATSSNWMIYLVLSVVLLITFSTMFTKIDKKKKLTVMLIGILCGTLVVSASDTDYIKLKGKVKYTSQNLMQESGTTLNKYKADYTKSVDIWKYAEEVKNIIISDNKSKPEDYNHKYDLTTNNSERIYGYLVKNKDSKVPYDLYIVSNGVIYAPENATGLFSFPNVEIIKGLEYIEFDNTTNMTAMFLGNEKLKSANVKDIDTSNATNTTYMFNGCDKLNVSEKDFNLSKVTNKKYMFNEKLINVVKVNAKSDKDIDFSKISSSTNGKGTYVMNGTEGNKNPIYYYRGAVTDNNVLFANKCWKIVRTTETGGIKLIYNGTPTSSGYCNRTGIYTQIGTSRFNSNYDSPASAGYMYGNVYKKLEKSATAITSVVVFGNDIEYKNGKYYLKDTYISENGWSTDYKTVGEKYHYTCFSTESSCEKVNYIYYAGKSDTTYYVELTDGKTQINILDEMLTDSTNENSSTIKTTIDNWYKNNMINYTDYLEDTVWCNDRSTNQLNGWDKDKNATSYLYFEAYGRNGSGEKPSLECKNSNDRFTVSSESGNGKLIYPVALLTADELVLAGAKIDTINDQFYLFTGQNWWIMTPSFFYYNTAIGFRFTSSGKLSNVSVNTVHDIRPSVSLKSGIDYVSGTGTTTNPYIIAE